MSGERKKARKMCFDRVLPRDLMRQQRSVAYGPKAEGRARAILPKRSKWMNGTEITIGFMGGTDAQQKMVRDFAPEWTNHANLKFTFTDDPRAMIRVTFDPSDGAWSYLGTDNLNIPLHAATLNLGWQDEGVILHEFGHMIGLAHEHSSPLGGIQWNRDAVIADLSGAPNFWDIPTIEHNVFHKYSVDQIHGTEFDKKSIMLYAFPNEWTIGDLETHENEKLSVTDKDFVRSAALYPPADPPAVAATELGVAAMVEAEISTGKEEDLFKFKADKSARYTVSTFGSTDVFMALYGPNNETSLIADDDDGGAGRNSMITAQLEPGEYYVQVRHYSEEGSGPYRILVGR